VGALVAHGGCCRACSADEGAFCADTVGAIGALERGSLEIGAPGGAGLYGGGLLAGDGPGVDGRGRVATPYGDGARGGGAP
jgi:hypothetical protein